MVVLPKKNSKMIKVTYSFIIAILFFGMSSCVSKKDIVYFGIDEIDQLKISNSYKITFKPDDLLQIIISSLDLEAVIPFNLPVISYATNNSAIGRPVQQTYLIDRNGNIDFPILGTIKLEGLTRDQAITLLKGKLSKGYIKDATVNILITNFRVSVFGDVLRPGVFTIPNERITILEAIAMAGDLNISGQRNNILVLREENGKKMQYRVNLLSNKIVTSPAFYLQQNDVVYVEQNRAKSQSAASNSNNGLFISITSIAITIVSLLIR